MSKTTRTSQNQKQLRRTSDEGTKRTQRSQESQIQPLNAEQQEILDWFQSVKFRKKLIGGVDEVHVWKKLEELNNLYDASIRAERARYDALLEANQKQAARVLRKYKKIIEGGGASE